MCSGIRRSLAVGLIVAGLTVAAGDDGLAARLAPEALARVVFRNDTDRSIDYLFFSSSTSRFWGADVLGPGRPLLPGQTREFYRASGEIAAYDILAIDERIDAHLMLRRAVTDDGVISFTNGTLESGFDLPVLAALTVENRTGTTLWFGFLSPTDSNARGVDILGQDTILFDGRSMTFRIPVGEQEIAFEFVGVDNHGALHRATSVLSERSLRSTATIRAGTRADH